MGLLGRTVRQIDRKLANHQRKQETVGRRLRLTGDASPDRTCRSRSLSGIRAAVDAAIRLACQPSDVSSEHVAIEVYPATTLMAHGIPAVPEGQREVTRRPAAHVMQWRGS